MEKIKTDVIVVGAGYAGLSAALELKKHGLETLLLEARDRVGGRIWSKKLDQGPTIDIGGQWIGPTQYLMQELVKQYDIPVFDTYDEGKNIVFLKEKLSTYSGVIPSVDIVSLLNLDYVLKKINRLSKEVNLESPWNTPGAEQLDSQTLATWMDRHFISDKAKFLFKVGVETVFACEPSEISLLHALYYAKSGDNMDVLISIPNGAQQTRFVNGAQSLCEAMLADSRAGIRYEQPVHTIRQHSDSVACVTDNLEVQAKAVIVTLPPALAGRIRYEPALPPLRDQLTQRLPMGTVVKCFAVYDKPFWRERGFSGQVVSDWDPVNVTFDNSPADGSCGILLAFIEAGNARRYIQLPEAERRAIILERFARYFGPEAASPLDFFDKTWADEPYSRGCYVGNMTPGGWTQYGEWLRKPCDRIHWAGTETAVKWNGYMDGAVDSGRRAVGEVLGYFGQ